MSYVVLFWVSVIGSIGFLVYGRVKIVRGELSAAAELLTAIWFLILALVFTFAYIGHLIK